MINLDHNATTPLHPAVLDAMHAVMAEGIGNPSSAHRAGRKARQLLEAARERIAAMLHAQPDEVLFTSGATEANNLAVFGSATTPCHIVTSWLEHPCVIEPCRQLAKHGCEVDWLAVQANGQVEVQSLRQALRTETKLVALQLVNHETGAVQPVAEAARLLPATVALHCDAAQAVGKMPIHFPRVGATTLSLSAHKFRGPNGIGALLVKNGFTLKAQQFGGHQQRGLRPGTEPVALAVGMATALELAQQNLEQDQLRLIALRKRFLGNLQNAIPDLVVNSPVDALPSTLNVSFPGVRSEVLLMALDMAGVAASTGSACSSGSLLPSPVLLAMGVSDAVLHSAMRFSFGAMLGDDDVREAAEHVVACVRRLR